MPMYVRRSRIPLAYGSSMQTQTTQHICPVWVLSASHHYTLRNLLETGTRYVRSQRARNIRKAGLLKHGALNTSRGMPSCKQRQRLCSLWPAGHPKLSFAGPTKLCRLTRELLASSGTRCKSLPSPRGPLNSYRYGAPLLCPAIVHSTKGPLQVLSNNFSPGFPYFS